MNKKKYYGFTENDPRWKLILPGKDNKRLRKAIIAAQKEAKLMKKKKYG
tara:strand:+ start:337 stop:483 length:147 start_codon:yes stop_codon:yes gene_type:complete